jgi:membrane dipeptidase
MTFPSLPAFTWAFSVLLAATAQAPSPVMDGHNHEVLEFQEGKVNFSGVKGTKTRGIHGSIFPLPVDRSPSKSLEVRIAEEINQIRLAAKTDRGFSVDEDPASLLTERIDEGLHLFLSIEWNGPIFGGDPASVQRYRSLGVRIICPMEKDSDALFEQDGSSLSLFGKQVLSAMNMAGVLFDITHLSHKQKLLIIALSELPVVASHSLVQSVTPLNFSLPDEVLSALASKGGSVWVSFNRRELLGEAAENCALDRLADNIDVLFKRLGPDHVGIGTDLQGDPNTVPAILNGIDAFSKIRECLKARGYSEILIDKIFWKNVLQALQRTEGQAGNHPSSSCPLKMTADNSSFKRGEMINDTPGLINGKEQIAARRRIDDRPGRPVLAHVPEESQTGSPVYVAPRFFERLRDALIAPAFSPEDCLGDT